MSVRPTCMQTQGKGSGSQWLKFMKPCVKFKAFQRVPVKDLRQQWANSNFKVGSIAVSQESISEEIELMHRGYQFVTIKAKILQMNATLCE